MKILILTPDIPYPLNMGGNVAQFGFSDYLRNQVEITYVFEIYNQDDESTVNQLQTLWENVEIIKVYHPNFYITKPISPVRRIFRKISVLAERVSKSAVTNVVEKSNPIFGNALWYLRPLSETYVNAVSEYIAKRSPDLIQIEHAKALSLAALDSGAIPKIFVHHEVQYAMLESASKNINTDSFSNYAISLTKNLEISLLEKFESILTFSEEDKQKLMDCGLRNVTSIPFPLLPDAFHKRIENSNIKINRLVFVGGDWHLPNLDAVSWYVHEFGADIYKRFGLKLHVIGRWNKNNVDALTRDFIKFEGFVEDLFMAGNNAIHLLPIRMGAGIRTKILSAFAYSQPVITTSIGAEGIGVENGIHTHIANTKIEFIEAIAKVLDNKKDTLNMCNAAFDFVQTNYNQKLLASKRLQLYNSLFSKTVDVDV